MEKRKNKYKSIKKAKQGFKLHFKTDGFKFMDPLLTELSGKFNIDIINFDDWLHKRGYIEENHGSMKNYIKLMYGSPAVEFIETLLRPKRTIKRRTRK